MVKFETFKRKIGRFLLKNDADYPQYMIQGNSKKIRIDKHVRGFSAIAKKIISEKRTLLGYDRLYTLWNAISSINGKRFSVLEIGVYKGGSLKFIALACKYFQKEAYIIGVDTFKGHVEITPSLDGKHRVNSQFSDVNIVNVFNYVKDFPNVKIRIGDIKDISKELEEIYSFVHVDVDVYKSTLRSLQFGFSRLVKGGIIIVDDYGFNTCKGARKAVDEFLTFDASVTAAFHLTTGQMVLIK